MSPMPVAHTQHYPYQTGMDHSLNGVHDFVMAFPGGAH
jgi:hypothetical protein